MADLLPVFEREGGKLAMEPHPDDFIELGLRSVDMIRGIASACVSFLYFLPHTFHQGDYAPGSIAKAGVLPTRVHQHAEIGRGDVDFDEAFAALAGIGFDGVLTTCVFGWDDQARESGIRMLTAIRELVTKHFPGEALAGVTAPGRPHFPQSPLPDDTAP